MRLTVLGCSGGYPVLGQPCSGYLVEGDRCRMWVDAGTGTLTALLAELDPWQLDAIWISHLHPDHWTDLPIALHRMAVTAHAWDRRPPRVFGPPGWEQFMGVAAQGYPSDRQPYIPVDLEDDAAFTVGGLQLHARAVAHRGPTFALRIESGARSMAYSADSAPCEPLRELAENVDLFLCEATLPPGRSSPISMNAAEAATLAGSAAAGQLLLTHLLPDVDRQAALEAAERNYQGRAQLAQPRLSVTIT